MFAKVFASSLVWGDHHSLSYTNIRFYLNPYTGQIEPIPTDHVYNYISYKNIKKLKSWLQTSPLYLTKFIDYNLFKMNI